MYSLSCPSGTLRKDGVVFAQDVNDAEYQQYAAWLAQGNGPEIIQDNFAPFTSIEVNAWQIRKALVRAGLRDAVEAAVASSGNQDLIDGWLHSPNFLSSEPMTLQLGASLGQNEEAMHQLFQLAAEL